MGADKRALVALDAVFSDPLGDFDGHAAFSYLDVSTGNTPSTGKMDTGSWSTFLGQDGTLDVLDEFRHGFPVRGASMASAQLAGTSIFIRLSRAWSTASMFILTTLSPLLS